MKEPGGQSSVAVSINRIAGYVLLSLVFLLLVCFLIREVSSFDVWFHLKTGQWIINNLSVPVTDMFSYTAAGNKYLDSHWLFQVALYAVYSIGGITGIQLLKIMVFIPAFLCLGGLIKKDNLITSAMVLFIAVILTQERFLIRPEMLTILFLGLYFLLLHNYKHKGTKFIWLLPLLQLIWVNMHSLFILGLLMVFAWLAGELAAGILKTRDDNLIRGSKYNRLLLILFLMSAACFINPYGIKGVSHPFLLFTEIGEGANVWMKTISELQPSFSMSMDSPVRIYYILLIVITAMSFMMNLRKVNITYLILYLGFLYISIKARRNISLFAFIAAPVAILNISNPSGEVNKFIEKYRGFIINKQIVFAALVMIISVFWIIDVASSNYFIKKNDVKRFGLGVSGSLYPEKAVDFIVENNIKGNMFNANSIGGYLIWRLTPERKVFVDGRWEVYGREFMDNYKAALTDMESFKKLLNRHEVNYILLNHISMESRRLFVGLYRDKGWELVYFDDIAAVLVRGIKENRSIIRDNPVDFSNLIKKPEKDKKLFQYNNFMKGMFFYSIEKYRNAAYEFSQAVLINPEYYEAYNNLGNTYQLMEEYDRAVDAYNKTIRLKPDYTAAKINLAGLYAKTGEYDRAETTYRELMKSNPGNAGNHYEMALLYEKQNNRDMFIKELEEVIRINPGHFNAHYKLAVACANDDPERTIRELKEAIRIKPEFAMGHYNLGIAYMKKNQPEKTAQSWREYIGLSPEGPNKKAVNEWLRKHDNE